MRKVLRWAVVPFAMVALASAAVPAAAVATTTYEIDLISLQCNRLQDPTAPDEPQLFIDGVSRFGPGSMHRGDTVFPSGTHQFTGTATMELFEIDNGQDDYLGTNVVGSAESGQGVQVAVFNFRNHAEYTLLYEVNPA